VDPKTVIIWILFYMKFYFQSKSLLLLMTILFYYTIIPKKIVLEPLREMDAKWLFLESLKYIYLYHSRKIMKFVWFYWNGTSKCTIWVTQGKSNLHPFTVVAQVQFFWVYFKTLRLQVDFGAPVISILVGSILKRCGKFISDFFYLKRENFQYLHINLRNCITIIDLIWPLWINVTILFILKILRKWVARLIFSKKLWSQNVANFGKSFWLHLWGRQ
jgi:hypothetical protein